MGALFDIGQPVGQILAGIVFLIPGLNATWILERLEGRSALSVTERLARAVSWSVLIYLPASGWLAGSVGRAVEGDPPIGLLALQVTAMLFVAPVVLGIVIALLLRSRLYRVLLNKLARPRAAPTAWDFAFSSADESFVRLTLRNGQMVGGRLAKESFASSWPGPRALFLQEAWSMSEEGAFIDPVPGTKGILIEGDAIERVELIEVSDVE